MNERRERILNLVTEHYIRSAHPVPSALLAQELRVSSATIRNELGALEAEGYVQQPHTSAGRIPTQLGYSLYARRFIPPQRLPKRLRRLLVERLQGSHGDTLLQQIAAVTAELSGYAVVVSLPADDGVFALEIHLSALSSSRLLAVVVLETGLTRQLMISLDPTPSDTTLREAESSLRQLTLPIGRIPAALSDIARRAHDEVARTFEALASNWPHMSPPRLFSHGLRNLLSEPESSDPNFVRLVLERVETPPDQNDEQDTLLILLKDDLAQVLTRLPFGSSRGGLMLLGPMRMRYPEALMIARGVSETVAINLTTDPATHLGDAPSLN